MTTHEKRLTETRYLGKEAAIERILTEAKRAGVKELDLFREIIPHLNYTETVIALRDLRSRRNRWTCKNCGHSSRIRGGLDLDDQICLVDGCYCKDFVPVGEDTEYPTPTDRCTREKPWTCGWKGVYNGCTCPFCGEKTEPIQEEGC